jgi:hypothetical protein
MVVWLLLLGSISGWLVCWFVVKIFDFLAGINDAEIL